ncbi:MAG: CorA family divalent cation transporter [Galbitalea sp.]
MLRYDRGGKPTPIPEAARARPQSTIAAAKRAGGFVWIGLEDADEAELAGFAAALGLHPLAVDDAATGKQQPKIQSFDEHLFVVIWVLGQGRNGQLGVGELFLFVRDGLLLTVQRNLGRHALDLPRILETTEAALSGGVVAALYGIMANVANTYSDIASDVETTLEELERQVFDTSQRDDGERIYRLRRQIGKLQRAVASLARALETSREHLSSLVIGDRRIEPYLRDLLDDLAGTAQLVSDQGSALDGVVSSHESNVASRQNEDTRKISAIAALLSVPAVLAGLYGMNFKNLPGVDWTYGWEALLGAIVILDLIMFVNFKRRHWL